MSRVVKEQMAAARVTSRARRFYPVLGLLGLGACTSVLGIEDLHEEPRPGTGGDTGTAGTSNNDGGKNNAGGKNGGGTTGNAGSANPDAGAGNGPMGGTAGTGTSGSMNNDAGAAGAVDPGDPTVRGHVIDIWGHKLADVPVQIGDTQTSTDANGAFVIPDVPSTYEVSLDIEYQQYDSPRSIGWVYQGLTRRDPTLQVRTGLPLRSGTVGLAAPGVTEGNDEQISLAFGGVDGTTDTTLGFTGSTLSGYWQGTDTSSQTAHALYWHYDHDTELPTDYYGYTSSSVLLSETETAQLSLTLTKGTLTSGNLQGTVTSGGGTDRLDQAWVHFTSGALMRLVDATGTKNFSYILPTLPKSSLTFAAAEGGDPYYGPFGIVVADGLTATSKPALTVPTPVKLTAPADQLTNVNASTKFTFGGASNPGPYVVQFVNIDDNGPRQAIFVVTAATQVTIPPVIGGGMQLKPNNVIEWRVATHGKYASVDAMAAPGGALQPFTDSDHNIDGPPRDGGEFTISSWRDFTTAP